VRVDRPLGVLAAGGEAVGHREQRHLDLHRRGSLEVAVDGAPVERALVDEEAEHEVVAGHGLEEAAEALARAESAADRAHHLLAEPIVAHEGHAAVLAHVVGGGLSDVVEKSAETERLTARELVPERLVERLAKLRAGLALELDQPLQHLERVPVDVEVVVVALLHVVQVRELRKNRPDQAEPVGQRKRLDRSRRHE
jgi:hypothetical protein